MPNHQPITEGVSRCARCELTKSAKAFYTVLKRDKLTLFRYCKPCCTLVGKDKKARLTKAELQALVQKYHLSNHYRMTVDEFNELRYTRQKGKCAICQGHLHPAHIDHCHKTGKIRGVLCGHCNLGIGNLKENITTLRNAIKYLQKYQRSRL